MLYQGDHRGLFDGNRPPLVSEPILSFQRILEARIAEEFEYLISPCAQGRRTAAAADRGSRGR